MTPNRTPLHTCESERRALLELNRANGMSWPEPTPSPVRMAVIVLGDEGLGEGNT